MCAALAHVYGHMFTDISLATYNSYQGKQEEILKPLVT